MAFAPPFQRTLPAMFDRRAAAAGNGLLNNLVAYWPLNEAGGANNALDLHTNGLTLTQYGSPGAGTGLVYSSARVSIANKTFYRSDALLRPGNTDFTFAAWVMVTTATVNAGIFGTWFTNNSEILCYIPATNLKPNFLLSADGNEATPTIIEGTALTLNQWGLVICQYDSVDDIMSIQINNGTAETGSHSGGAYIGTAPFRLSSFWNSSLALNGRIGPVAMWKSAAGGGGCLSAAQRTALYNAGAGLAYAQFTT